MTIESAATIVSPLLSAFGFGVAYIVTTRSQVKAFKREGEIRVTSFKALEAERIRHLKEQEDRFAGELSGVNTKLTAVTSELATCSSALLRLGDRQERADDDTDMLRDDLKRSSQELQTVITAIRSHSAEQSVINKIHTDTIAGLTATIERVEKKASDALATGQLISEVMKAKGLMHG